MDLPLPGEGKRRTLEGVPAGALSGVQDRHDPAGGLVEPGFFLQDMLLLEDPYLYLMMFSSIAVAFLGTRLLMRRRARAFLTGQLVRTQTAKEYVGGHRLYGLVEGDLLWAYDMAAMGQQLQPHLWGRLVRQ